MKASPDGRSYMNEAIVVWRVDPHRSYQYINKPQGIGGPLRHLGEGESANLASPVIMSIMDNDQKSQEWPSATVNKY